MFKKINRETGLNLKNVSQHESHGFMSEIYTADSDKGKVVIHIIDPIQEQRRQKVHIKTKFLLNLLEDKDIPTSTMYNVGEIGDKYYMVQEYLEGEPLGRRKLVDGKIIDTYDFEGYEEKVKELLFRFNEVEIDGYGWIFGNETRYDTWREFLEKEAQYWLKALKEKDYEVPELSYFKGLLDENEDLINCDPNLVHGDLLNPSNILVEDGEITGVLDYEWSLAGDPAWDYAFTHSHIIDEEFSRRVRLYKIFWNLWGAGMHLEDELFEPLYSRFQKAIESFDDGSYGI